MIDENTENTESAPTPEASEPIKVDAASLEKWAIENKDQAKALGMWIVMNMNDKSGALPGTGAFQDAAVEWARANPMTARMLFLSLMTKLK